MTFDNLQQLLPDKHAALLFFVSSEKEIFLKYAIPLLTNGYSVGIGTKGQLNRMHISFLPTHRKGLYLLPISIQEASILCFSSGTINNEKGILRTFKSWQQSFSLMSAIIGSNHSPRGIVMGALPYSLSLFGAMESLYRKKQPLFFDLHQRNKWANCNENSNYILWLTPMHCTSLIKIFALNKKPLSTNIQFVFVGGAHFSNPQRDRLQAVFPNAKIYSFYGTSETSFISLKPPTDQSESVGTVCQGVAVSIRDEENQLVPPYSQGTIWVCSSQLFSGYIQSNIGIDIVDGAIATADIGYLDFENRLFFVGRKAHQLSICGHIMDIEMLEKWYKNVIETENLALLHQPHQTKENELILMLSKPISPKQWTAIKHKARATLGPQGVASKWRFCALWPITENGKLDRKVLSELL